MNSTPKPFDLDPHAKRPTPQQATLCAYVAETLLKHYPGHPWVTGVTDDGSCVFIKNMLLSGKMGIHLPIPDINTSSDFEQVIMRKGGLILEQYAVARRKADRELIESMPTDLSGDVILLK